MIRFVVPALLLSLACANASAATVSASDCSSSAVQSAINNAGNGDTVLLPASQSASWSSDVSLPSSKYITLDGNNCKVTLAGGTLTVNASTSGNNRVTRFTFTVSDSRSSVSLNDSTSGAAWIFDNSTVVNNQGGLGPIVNMNGVGKGLMHHVTMSNLGSAQEFIHIWGWGATSTTGWTTSVDEGGAGLLYLEDNTFTGKSTNANVAWIQGYYGSRTVFRHNQFNYAAVDMHGTPGMVGARWWEGYENTFWNEADDNQNWGFNMRGGTGVLFNNKFTGGQRANIGLCEEDSGYPAPYQIGRGTNNTSEPAYVWNNTNMAMDVNGCDAPEVPGMVQLNRDVYASAKPGYTPYTYPHPLQGGSKAQVAPMPPTSVAVD
jgi:hypothetical protein